jgi:hypothetical protein
MGGGMQRIKAVLIWISITTAAAAVLATFSLSH